MSELPPVREGYDRIVIELPTDQAEMFILDWESDPAAPILSGGRLENDVYVIDMWRMEP